MLSKTPYAISWCYEVLTNGVYFLANEYCTHLKNQISEDASFENFNIPENKTKIRYSDVKMNDNCRVKIEKENNSTDFIHANYVSTPFFEKRFIATQGPLVETQKDFWRMIIENSVEAIVMLCNTVENNKNKCSLYFPHKVGNKIILGDIIITCLETGPISERCKDVTKTIVEITNRNEIESNSHLVCHYRWINWPDKSVPKDIEPLVMILDSIRQHKTPIVVHCSAGIGRTSTFIAIEHYLERVICNDKLEDGISYVKFLRKMRQHAVQTDHQYVFIHYCIVKIILGDFKHLLPASVLELYEKFENDYETFT